MQADTLIADKAFDADERVLEPLAGAGKTAAIPPRANRSEPHEYDRPIYTARHLIETFFANRRRMLSTPKKPQAHRSARASPDTHQKEARQFPRRA
jgi:hypothetical protein